MHDQAESAPRAAAGAKPKANRAAPCGARSSGIEPKAVARDRYIARQSRPKAQLAGEIQTKRGAGI